MYLLLQRYWSRERERYPHRGRTGGRIVPQGSLKFV
jgi:hypothetical protein